MNIKDIFDKAENGVLTYDQFVAAATEAKNSREDCKVREEWDIENH